MTDTERLDWVSQQGNTIETGWDYRRGFVVRLGTHLGIHEGDGRTLRDAFDCAMRIKDIDHSQHLI